MARKKPSSGIGTNPVPFGMSNRVMKRKKPINLDYIKKIEPLTDNQQKFFDSYKEDKNLVAYGCAGTGKTFITLYNALMQVLDNKTPYEKIYIVRSLVPIAKKSQFLAIDSEIRAAAGVSIRTPIGIGLGEILIFLNDNSFFTSSIIFFVSNSSDTFDTIGNIILTLP